ncbi:MAG TPA: hypothetical protein VE967_13195 [Gemmatimonadaceae bacterium]|nr:hypothetical protein [Gemmatimonadaceae bacterium]
MEHLLRIPGPGDIAPNISIPGTPLGLHALRGEPLLVILHATAWDPGRETNIFAFNRIIRNAPGGFAARLLATTGGGSLRHLLFQDDLAISVIATADPVVAAQFNVRSPSAVFVVDEESRIRWRYLTSDQSLSPPSEVARLLGVGAHASERARAQFLATIAGTAFALGLGGRFRRARAHRPVTPWRKLQAVAQS